MSLLRQNKVGFTIKINYSLFLPKALSVGRHGTEEFGEVLSSSMDLCSMRPNEVTAAV
jgi:hypothetical protein